MNPNSFVPESCCDVAVGDRGQRYEVRFFSVETGEEKRMGWTERPDGGALLSSAKLWPSARDPFIVDRQSKHEWVSDKAAYPVCRVCGLVRKRDEREINPCKGLTRMRKMEDGF